MMSSDIDDLKRVLKLLIAEQKLTPDDVDALQAACPDLRQQVDTLLLVQAARRKQQQKKLN